MNITPPPRFLSLSPLTAVARSLPKLALVLASVAGAVMLTACSGESRALAPPNSPGASAGSSPVELLKRAGANLGNLQRGEDGFDFFGGSSGGMSHYYPGRATETTYLPVNITVTHDFGGGSDVAGLNIQNANVSLGSDDIVATISLSSSSFQGRSFRKDYGAGAGVLYVDAYTDVTSRTENSDYMTGGIWLYLPNEDTSNNLPKLEFGAFAYANSLADRSRIPGIRNGNASFAGETTGAFSGQNAGTYEVGYFAGQVALSVNFRTRSVSGEITNIESYWYDEQGYARLAPFPVQFTVSNNDIITDYNTKGYFSDTNIDDNSNEYTTTGEWAAAFTGTTTGNVLNINDITGIIGTYRGEIAKDMDADTWWDFVGVFGAHKQ